MRIRIEWGGLTAYVDSGMFEYCWDGGVRFSGGRLAAAYQLEMKHTGHYFYKERWRPLSGCSWRSRTDQTLSGVILDVDGDAGTVVEVTTAQKAVRFTLGELQERRYLRWPVGAKYSGITLAAMVDGEGPFRVDAEVAPGCLDLSLAPDAFRGAAHYGVCNATRGAFVLPGRSVAAILRLPRAPYRGGERRSALTLEVRLSLAESLEKGHVDRSRYSPLTVTINDQALESPPVYFRTGEGPWRETQWLECVPFAVPPECLRQGENRLVVRNESRTDILVVASAQLREAVEEDLQIASWPRWVLRGERFDLLLRCLRPHRVSVTARNAEFTGACPVALEEGLHRLAFTAGARAECAAIEIGDGQASRRVSVPVYAVGCEEHPWLVGGTLQTVKHDASREVDLIIDYCKDTRMGNYLQFRTDPSCRSRWAYGGAQPESWARWARLCRERDVYFTMINAQGWENYKAEPYGPDPELYEWCRVLKEQGGHHFFSTHFHEYSRWIYGMPHGRYEPLYPEGRTVRDARDQYVRDAAAIRGIAGIARQSGQSAPLMAYDYESGMDVIAVETVALNASHLLAAQRGAARAYGKKRWGVHNAAYWAKAPDDFTKPALHHINCYLTYLSGGNLVISEDGHFNVPEAHRPYGFHSEEPVIIREILRRFYRYASTHPRRGEPRATLAVAQGNLSCEILSFPLEFANLRAAMGQVWGTKGGMDSKWRYGDPERGLVLLDELMPYWQDGHHIRHWFTGTPYGAFEITPVWKASGEVLATYKVLLFLGWNTMTEEIYAKLRRYVAGGGTLFMAVPHLSTHEDRAFLATMADLALIHGGDFADLFGVRIEGPGEAGRLAPKWVAGAGDARFAFPMGARYGFPGGAAPVAPAQVANVSARVLVRDEASGAPLLTEHAVGKGRAYLLTTRAYPGNPALHPLARDIVAALGEGSQGEVRLGDPSREVAWSVWEDATGLRSIYLLNTDWTEPGNVKACRLLLGGAALPIEVKEGDFAAVVWRGKVAAQALNPELYVEDVAERDGKCVVTVHGCGRCELRLFLFGGKPASIKFPGAPAAFEYDPETRTSTVALDFGDATRGEVVVEMAHGA